MREHAQDYPYQTAAVTRRPPEGLSRDFVRRWLAQAEVDDGTRLGVASEELAEISRLKSKNRRLREDNEILRRAHTSSRQRHPEDGPAGTALFFAACGDEPPASRLHTVMTNYT